MNLTYEVSVSVMSMKPKPGGQCQWVRASRVDRNTSAIISAIPVNEAR